MDYPKEFLDRMKDMLQGEYPDFLDALSAGEYKGLRMNPLKGLKEDFLQSTSFSLCPIPWSEYGYYYGEEDAPGRHPWHEAGVYYIQEPSAQAPVSFLDIRPGERVLDLCAAPGGKSTQAAAALKGRGLLVSNEINPARAKILSENIERMGVRNALVLNETPERLTEAFPEYFDKIIVDAPCSGEGMFRKNKEAVAEWSPENVTRCARRQARILDCAAVMLRPGGRMVYSTCTFAVEENEASIEGFLERNPGFQRVDIRKRLPGGMVCPEGEAAGNMVRLWPHRVKGEGHFLALVQKGEAGEGGRVWPLHGLEKGCGLKEVPAWESFVRATFRGEAVWWLPDKGEKPFLLFGEQLYRMPDSMPCLKGLKVLRPGLHLGTIKNLTRPGQQRFEPSHALALALTPEEVRGAWRLEEGDGLLSSYLQGGTFPGEGDKGWYLICAGPYSIGWGKLAGGIMKNHYPKGLRKFYAENRNHI